MTRKIISITLTVWYIIIGGILLASFFGLYIDIPLNRGPLVILTFPLAIGRALLIKPKAYWALPIIAVLTYVFIFQNTKGYVGVKLYTQEYTNCPISTTYISSQGEYIFNVKVAYVPTPVPFVRRELNDQDMEIMDDCT
jgi:hypothetical protein